ncbi:MAG: PxKF domain-containing protein [Myxococcota bacterium]
MLLALAGCSGSAAEFEAGHTRAALLQDAPVVISQIYGGGGNNLAPFKNDFVELFNRSQNSVSLAGWSLQYASATGTGTFASNPVTVLSGTLASGQRLLVQMAAGAGTAPALPTPDVVGSVNMSATGGKIVLVNSVTPLTCNGPNGTPCSAAQEGSIVDLVGWDGANYFETAAAPATSNTMAVLRKNNGCDDTNNNAADFVLGPPDPGNSASPFTACDGATPPRVVNTVPANGAQAVATDASLTIAFSEPVTTSESWFSLACSNSGTHAADVSGGPTSFALTPSQPFTLGDACTLSVSAAAVHDVDAGLPMAADFQFSFNVLAPLTAIHAIQGASHLSALAGASVRTSGVVTAVRSNGYYLQDLSPDADPATSEGIFVFTSTAPVVQPGDTLEVSGTVSEFRPGCGNNCTPSSSGYNNLSITEIVQPTSVLLSAGNPLPAPVVIGNGGRVPPNAIIENDTSGSVELPGNLFDPSEDGIDFYESLEGMRVQLNDALVVGPTRSFSATSRETYVVGDLGANASLRTPRGGVVINASDKNPERLILGNSQPALPDANVGDTFPGAIVGVLDYDFGNYRLLASQALPALSSNGIARESLVLAPAGASDLNIAAFNVENLDPGDPPSKFSELAQIIVTNLRAPDILALEEVQDNNGATDSGVVDASVTFNQLIQGIQSAGGPAYQFRSIDPVNDQDGGEPGGNIRVGFLFRTDRGLAFVDRPGATSLTPNAVITSAAKPSLAYSPGRIDPTNGAFSNSRKPLAAEFTFNGETLFVVANHFNSKGGDQPLFGRFQPPTLNSETQRLAQAQVVAAFVGQILSADAHANVIVLGDLNDFEFSPPLAVLKNAGLTPLIETLPPSERYTYVFEGNSQALDHVMVSSHALARSSGFDIVHVNSEFAAQASDHDPGVARLSLDGIAPTLTGPGDLVVPATSANGAIVDFVVTASDNVDTSPSIICTKPSGALFPLGTTLVSCSANDAHGNTAQISFSVRVEVSTEPGAALFRQPINNDGSSVFKLGRTIPVKFGLTGASAGITNLVARLYVTKVSDQIEATYVEPDPRVAVADSGGLFRYDPTSQQYIYNLATCPPAFSQGTWELRVDLGDGVLHGVRISLRR